MGSREAGGEEEEGRGKERSGTFFIVHVHFELPLEGSMVSFERVPCLSEYLLKTTTVRK